MSHLTVHGVQLQPVAHRAVTDSWQPSASQEPPGPSDRYLSSENQPSFRSQETRQTGAESPGTSLKLVVGENGPTLVGPNGQVIPVTMGADGNLQIQQADLLKMAVDANPSVQADPGFVNPLAPIDPMHMSPMGDFLEIPAANAREVLAERQPEVHRWAQQHKRFSADLKAALQQPDGSPKQAPLEDLREMRDRWLASGERLYPDQVTTLMEAFQGQGAFADSSRLYETMRDRDPNLAHYEIPREYYIVCLNKTKRLADSIREGEAFINERVEQVHHGPMGFIEASRRNVYRSLGINGEVLGGMGKAYKSLYQQAEQQIDDKVRSADFAGLFEQLSGTARSDWNVEGVRLQDLAHEQAVARVKERIAAIGDRSFDEAQNVEDMVRWVELSTGTERAQWAGHESDAETARALAQAEDPIAAVAELTGLAPQEWSICADQLKSAGDKLVNGAAGRVVRGKDSREDLLQLARNLTGKDFQGALTRATFDAKVDELFTGVTEGGSLDKEMVGFVERNAATPIGRNLLKASRKALEVSRDYYLAGFGVDFEYYPGINVVYNEFALGNQKTAETLAPLVQYSVMREGGATSKDFWNLATQTELAGITNQADTAHDLVPRLLKSAKAGWELGSTADNLEWLSGLRKEEGKDTTLLDVLSGALRSRIQVGFPPPEGFDLDAFVGEVQGRLRESCGATPARQRLTPEEQRRKDITDRIFDKATHFQDVFNSKFVGGSWKFVSRGGVSDTPINRQTVRALREVNRHLGLDKVDSPDGFPVFHSRVHRYIDTKFSLYDPSTGERPMEDLDSDVHKKRDKFTQARHDVCHSRISGSGQTNLAVEIMLGQSDCRHTKITYQGCFDLWKRDRQTQHLQNCLDAVLDGHEETLKREFEKAQAWNRIQVVSPDLAFYAPIQLRTDEEGKPVKYALAKDAKGLPVRTEDGGLLRGPDGQLQALEDHSMPFLMRLDEKGLILPEDGLKAVDPFYKDFYPLADRAVDPAGILDDEKGLYLGRLGVSASDGKPVDFWGKPTRYSGTAPQKIPGECGQVTFGGLEVAMNDLTALLSEDNRLTHLVDAMTGMVTGTSKERVLNAVLSRMLDEAAADSHQIWKRAKDRELMNPDKPFLGWASERVTVPAGLADKSDVEIREWVLSQNPRAEVPDWKLPALRTAPEGAAVFDPRYLSYGELLASDQAVSLAGEVAVAPLALALYLQDFRQGEDLRYVLDNILTGKDDQGRKDLEKVHRVGQLAAQLVQGERSYAHTVDRLARTGQTKEIPGRADFLSWHTIHENDKELAELDAYTLKPAAEWLLGHLDQVGTDNGGRVLTQVMGELIESAAADAHNVGWKSGKDRAFADPGNPFVGWAPKRQRISSTTPQVAEMSREQIAEFYGVPVDAVSEEKAEAIRAATVQAVADGTEKGADVTHQLYKEYNSMLGDQSDGGVRLAGGNAVPLMTLALYLADFREDTTSVSGLRRVLQGLLDGTDKDGLKHVTMLNHVAFQAAQLPYGERSDKVEVPELARTGETREIPARPEISTLEGAPAGSLEESAGRVRAGLQWLNRDLDQLVAS